MRYALDHGFLEASWLQRAGWRAIGLLTALVDPSRPTPFMNQPLQPALAAA